MVLVAAGGTGGHIFPGLAVADAVRRSEPDARVVFMGTNRGLEGRLVPERGYPLRIVAMRPLTRKLGIAPVLAVLSFFRATFQARRILRRDRVDVVVGMGGYASLPAVAAAGLRGIPSIVHESGAVPGLANKVAARFTRNVAVAFEDASRSLPRPARVIGMPLDPGLASVDRPALRSSARRELKLPEEGRVVLIVGGSLGAKRLNELGVSLAARWRDSERIRVLLKAGSDHLPEVERSLRELGASEVVRSVAFIERMDHAYAAADVAVCRAGAGTVAELAAAGLPAVLIPYPHAPDDHQTKNGGPLARAGGAVIVPDAQAVGERIGPLIEEMLDQPGKLEVMSKAARGLARPGAAEDLAAWALELAGTRR
ncbi:MAG TPA: undecaprenyldiphospho-muramoylpentapeptide beta-N-acetylglucosaminyltransferase, partial [Actinomycetota bacterium]|nr:undecaprenyldiphospho-muramoylpentapeptide beta-N-acetylglucosaminyltransferase [Actinomycetota bacterium]